MAAREIPDLRKILAARAGHRGRGRGRGISSGRFELNEDEKDRIVQETDWDASDSRLSAVELGYLQDPFVHRLSHGRNTPRRYPIINRGTYVRSAAVDSLVDKFLQTDPAAPKQILSLGAGSDTRYLRIASRDSTIPLLYHELDFSTNTRRKVEAFKEHHDLLRPISATLSSPDDLVISASGDGIQSSTYNLTPIDLRKLANPELQPALPNLSPTTPTLILSECCLCYLPPELTISILDVVVTKLLSPKTPVSLILYEPIRPFDSFGRVMESNLASRGIHLQTLHRYCSLTAQRARLKQTGFIDGQCAADVDFIFENWITESEKERIGQCEMLDELEEWRLLAKHYCVAWGWRNGEGSGSGGADIFARAWKGVKNQEEIDE